jgi:hypothetical protein
MAARRTTFGKTQREREKRAKQAAKRERRLEGSDENETTEETAPAPTPVADQEAVISALEALHQRYDQGGMSLEDFEEHRQELLARLTV